MTADPISAVDASEASNELFRSFVPVNAYVYVCVCVCVCARSRNL